jgi:hypothetical protein
LTNFTLLFTEYVSLYFGWLMDLFVHINLTRCCGVPFLMFENEMECITLTMRCSLLDIGRTTVKRAQQQHVTTSPFLEWKLPLYYLHPPIQTPWNNCLNVATLTSNFYDLVRGIIKASKVSNSWIFYFLIETLNKNIFFFSGFNH